MNDKQQIVLEWSIIHNKISQVKNKIEVLTWKVHE